VSDDIIRRLRADDARLSQTEIKEVPGGIPGFTSFYASGVYTPTYLGLTTPGVTTYTTQLGSWTRNGRMVTVTVFLNWSAATGTGIAIISLPFAPSYVPTGIRYNGAANKSANVRTAVAEAGGGAQVAYLVTGGAAEAVTGTGDITMTLSYFV